MRLILLFAILLLVSPAVAAHTPDDTAAVEAVLDSYKKALEARDLTGVEALFGADNVVLESGKLEGTYADYRDHHIGPELGHFESFQFSDYVVKVHVEGPVAWATETYRYTIHLKDKPEPIERQGVATSVLRKVDGQWRIVSMHNSSRAPKPPAK